MKELRLRFRLPTSRFSRKEGFKWISCPDCRLCVWYFLLLLILILLLLFPVAIDATCNNEAAGEGQKNNPNEVDRIERTLTRVRVELVETPARKRTIALAVVFGEVAALKVAPAGQIADRANLDGVIQGQQQRRRGRVPRLRALALAGFVVHRCAMHAGVVRAATIGQIVVHAEVEIVLAIAHT